MIVHTREADQDTLRILEDSGKGEVRGVFHCFTGDAALAAAALELGFYLSFSGIVSFPKSDALRAVAATVPADRLLMETDSPYLAPVPHRGKRNEPALVVHVAEALAAARRTTPALRSSSRRPRTSRRCSRNPERPGAARVGAVEADRRHRAVALTPLLLPVVRLTRVSDVHKSQSPLDLAQIFEPVRDDLARVDQEFLRSTCSRAYS